MQINGNKKEKELKHSMPNQRFVLRFNKNDTVHLRFGETNVDLIINPKPCVVCLDKARTIRNKCGHLVLCSTCYEHMICSSQQCALCPICRSKLDKSKLHHEFDMIQSYCKPPNLL